MVKCCFLLAYCCFVQAALHQCIVQQRSICRKGEQRPEFTGSFSKSSRRMSCTRGIIKSEQCELQNNLLCCWPQRPLCEGKWAFCALPEGSCCTPVSLHSAQGVLLGLNLTGLLLMPEQLSSWYKVTCAWRAMVFRHFSYGVWSLHPPVFEYFAKGA